MIEDPPPGGSGDGSPDASPTPNGSGGRHRTRLLVLVGAAVAVVVAAVLAVAILPRDGDHHPHAHSSAPANSTCHLKIVDHGFTVVRPYLGGEPDPAAGDMLRYALLLKNPCRSAATGIEVDAFPEMASGKSLRKRSGDVVSDYVLLSTLLPGQTVGLYDRIEQFHSEVGEDGHDIHDAAKVTFSTHVQCWRRASEVTPKTRSMAEHVRVGPPDADGHRKDREAWLRFTLRLEPAGSKLQQRSVNAIFRDHSGKILAGSGDELPANAQGGKQQKIRVWLPRGADPKKTKVYLTELAGNGMETPDFNATCVGPQG